MKSLLKKIRYPVLLLAFAGALGLTVLAQDTEPPTPDVPAPADVAEVVEPVEPVEPAEPAAAANPAEETESHLQQALREARNKAREAINEKGGVQIRGGQGEAVAVGRSLEVSEGDSVPAVVAVLGDYVLKGRSRGEAVAVLSSADVQGEVDGECVTVLGELRLVGHVKGDLVVVASKAFIDGVVDGEVTLVMSEAEFGPNARISGQTRIVGPSARIDPDAVFQSTIMNLAFMDLMPPALMDVVLSLKEYVSSALILGRPIAPGLAWCWYVVGFFFLFRFIVVLLFPKPIEIGATILRERAMRSFLVGLIAYILSLPAQVLLAATGVGAIAVPFLMVALAVAAMLGKIAVLRTLGGEIGRQIKLPMLDTPLGGFIAGTVLVTAIYCVPVLGIIVFLLIKPMALGAMLIAAADSFRREGSSQSPVPPTLGQSGSATAAATSVGLAAAAQTGESAAETPVQPTASPSGQVPPVLGQPRPAPPSVSPEELLAMPRVGFWPRFGATFLDLILVLVVVNVALERLGGDSLFVPLWLAYHVAMWTWRGTTLGGIVFSLRIVRLDGRAPDFTVCLVRALAGCLSFVVACLGFFWASWNPEKQSWHDMIAGTVIVKTPRSMPLV